MGIFTALVNQIQNMTVDQEFNNNFVSFLEGLLTIKTSPGKQRLIDMWKGEIKTVKGDSRNIGLWFQSHHSVLS